jgi:hypothetical protein
MGSPDVPAAPSQPSSADAINAWIEGMPKVYQTQLQYAPLQAEQQATLAETYAGRLGSAYKTAQESMYPETSALQEKLAKQASEGMDSEMPSWAKDMYLNNTRANIGTNAGSGIGADYTSRGLVEQNKGWQDYYRNLGLATAGRQPLSNPTSPQTTDYMSSFTPQSTMNFAQQGYGTAGNIYGSQLQYGSQNNASMMGLIGSGIGAVGTMGGAAMMSSARYKTNIKLWA